jgi:hypothetical protein
MLPVRSQSKHVSFTAAAELASAASMRMTCDAAPPSRGAPLDSTCGAHGSRRFMGEIAKSSRVSVARDAVRRTETNVNISLLSLTLHS